MNALRDLLTSDVDTFASLKRLGEAARTETEMLLQLQFWRDEIGAQLDNIDQRKRLVLAYEME
jgi:hypothetical protein